MCRLTVLSHELVELVQRLCVFGCWVVGCTMLRTGLTLLGVGGRRLAAVAAHKRRQNGGVVHPAVQSPKQNAHALGYNGRVPALAAASSICAPPADRKRLHLQLLPSSYDPSLSVHVLGGRRADGMLPAVAEATVLVLMVLQEVMDRSQPQGTVRA